MSVPVERARVVRGPAVILRRERAARASKDGRAPHHDGDRAKLNSAARAIVIGLLCLATLATHARAADQAERFAYVTVAGAPGDGEQALAASLSRKLAAIGLAPATAFQANVYEVQGTVRVAPAAKGKESVTIVWVVLDPDGQQLGVVRQMRDVRKGSLDKRWGQAAEAAAESAAADIAALLPR